MLNDPQEQRNLSGEVAAAGQLADHRRMLAEWEAAAQTRPAPPGGWLKVAFGRDPEEKIRKGNRKRHIQ